MSLDHMFQNSIDILNMKNTIITSLYMFTWSNCLLAAFPCTVSFWYSFCSVFGCYIFNFFCNDFLFSSWNAINGVFGTWVLGYQCFSHMSHSFNVFFCCLLFCLTCLIHFISKQGHFIVRWHQVEQCRFGGQQGWHTLLTPTYVRILSGTASRNLTRPKLSLARRSILLLPNGLMASLKKLVCSLFSPFFFLHHIISNLVTITYWIHVKLKQKMVRAAVRHVSDTWCLNSS